MASIEVRSYVDIGTGSVHDATTWQFAKDPEFTKIIDESIKDKRNVKVWHSPLRKLPEDRKNVDDLNEFYNEEDEIYARVKIHCGETTSEWFPIGPISQRRQRVLVTDTSQRDEDGNIIRKEYITNSTELGWTTEPWTDEDMRNPDILGPLKTPSEIELEEMERIAKEAAIARRLEEERKKLEQEALERLERQKNNEESRLTPGDLSPTIIPVVPDDTEGNAIDVKEETIEEEVVETKKKDSRDNLTNISVGDVNIMEEPVSVVEQSSVEQSSVEQQEESQVETTETIGTVATTETVETPVVEETTETVNDTPVVNGVTSTDEVVEDNTTVTEETTNVVDTKVEEEQKTENKIVEEDEEELIENINTGGNDAAN